ncbi:MAG: outer membrane beta-barrel protein [Candidatus Aminicenantes bacterium]|nr:outer membrane beta-barrel protein [Candidatus Aminicenantes bacterium]
MTKRILMILLTMALLNISLVSKEDSKYSLFVNSSFFIIEDTDGVQLFAIGGGFGFKLNSKFDLQGAFDYINFKEEIYERHNGSIYSFLIDLKYNLGKKRLAPYFILSCGITVKHRIDNWASPFSSPDIEEETIINFSPGCGAGLSFRLSRVMRLFIESRFLLLISKEDGTGGYAPVKFGVAFDF